MRNRTPSAIRRSSVANVQAASRTNQIQRRPTANLTATMSSSVARPTRNSTNTTTPNTNTNASQTMTRTSNFQPSSTNSNSNNPSIIRGRPKRCMYCRKMIASELYNQHIGSCNRFQAGSSTNPGSSAANKNIQRSGNSITTTAPATNISVPSTKVNIDRNQSFRIKKVNGSATTGRNSSNNPALKPTSEGPEATQIKEEIRRGLAPLERIPSAQSEELHQQPVIVRARPLSSSSSSSSSSDSSIGPTRVQITRHQPSAPVVPPRPPVQSISDSSSEEEPIQPPAPPTPPRHEFVGQLRNQENNPLIVNTDQLYRVVGEVGLLRNNQQIRGMIQHLQQLNNLGRQMEMIGRLGNSVGQTYIAQRIGALQSIFIREIGEALLRSLSAHVLIEATLVFQDRPPAPSVFTRSQIQAYFPSERSVSQQTVNCSICLADILKYDLKRSLRCGHDFHPHCIQEWLVLKTTCPMCRQEQRELV